MTVSIDNSKTDPVMPIIIRFVIDFFIIHSNNFIVCIELNPLWI